METICDMKERKWKLRIEINIELIMTFFPFFGVPSRSSNDDKSKSQFYVTIGSYIRGAMEFYRPQGWTQKVCNSINSPLSIINQILITLMM